MSFLKQLLTPFIEFDDQKKEGQKNVGPAPVVPQQQPAPAPAAQQQPVPPPPPAPPVKAEHPLINVSEAAPVPVPDQVPHFSPSGNIDAPLPEHVQYFEKLIDEANRKHPPFQGTDYKEFVDSKVDIDDITDEALRYRTAYNVLKSTGLTKERLLATGQEYIDVIGRDLNAFQGAHSLKYQKEVRQKEELIQKKAEELQALTIRIQALKGEINTLTQDINLTKDNLNTLRNSFMLAGENKQREIQTELQKIAQYF